MRVPVLAAVVCIVPTTPGGRLFSAASTVESPISRAPEAALAVIWKAAEACLAGSAWLVAVTVTDVLEETAGAVNKPADVIDPALADQLTCELEVLLTVGGELLLAPPV